MKKLSFLLLCVMLAMTSCVKSRFNVEFSIKPTTPANCRLVYYASSKKQALMIETNVILKEGKGSTVCTTRYPTVVFVFSSGSRPRAAFWAERGDKIKISGQGDDPAGWTYEGNEISKQWSRWRQDNLQTLRSANPEAINSCVAAYVAGNTDKRLSALLLLVDYDRSANPTQWQKLWNSLSEDARSSEVTEAVGNADFAGGLPQNNADARLTEMVIRTYPYGCDTIKPEQHAKTFLFLWTPGDGLRSKAIDSIRNLRKAFPDSSSYLIADICMDPDSLLWTAPLVSDSLYGVVRGWMPRGLADPDMIRLGPGATPWFIIGKRGKIIYSGKNLDAAASTFRH